MPRTLKMTDDHIVDDLRNTYGVEFTAADIKGYCASRGMAYQTITKRLEKYKDGRAVAYGTENGSVRIYRYATRNISHV